MGGHQLAMVVSTVGWYCVQSHDTTFTNNESLNYIAQLGDQNVLEISSNIRQKDSRKPDSTCSK